MDHNRLIYRITTALTVLLFVGSGIANLLHVEHIATDMRTMGYPAFFMTVLGTWKVLGAAAVAAPGLARLKEWAYAGMVFDLTGAAISRCVTGFGPIWWRRPFSAAERNPPVVRAAAIAMRPASPPGEPAPRRPR